LKAAASLTEKEERRKGEKSLSETDLGKKKMNGDLLRGRGHLRGSLTLDIEGGPERDE